MISVDLPDERHCYIQGFIQMCNQIENAHK